METTLWSSDVGSKEAHWETMKIVQALMELELQKRPGKLRRAAGWPAGAEDEEGSAPAAERPSDCSPPSCLSSPGDLPDACGAVAARQGAAHDLPGKVEKPAGCLLNPIILLSGTSAKSVLLN